MGKNQRAELGLHDVLRRRKLAHAVPVLVIASAIALLLQVPPSRT